MANEECPSSSAVARHFGIRWRRRHLVELRPNRISASNPPSTWWPGGAMKFVSRMPEMTTARYAAVISTVGFFVSLPQHLEEHDHDPERANQQQGVRSNILSRDAAIDVKDMTQETGN
jgi:hypothetical protein